MGCLKVSCQRCFYCEAFLSSTHEHDHFPVSNVNGGKDVVPACRNCHDLKDRQSLLHWLPQLIITAANQLVAAWPEAMLWYDAHPYHLAHALPPWREVWPNLGTPGRLLYAKLVHVSQQDSAMRTKALS